MDHKEARKEFEEIVGELAIEFVATPEPGNDYAERGRPAYQCTIGAGENVIRCRYTVGSAIPLSDFRDGRFEAPRSDLVRLGLPRDMRAEEVQKAASKQGGALTIYEAQARVAIRRAYLPHVVDVLSSLLMDDDGIEDKADWPEWAEDFGALEGANAQKLRELERDFAEVRSRAYPLRRLCGSKFERLKELAREL